MALTEGLVEGSLIFAVIGYILAILFQLYALYLNWKQSKVNNQMTELITEVKGIRKELKDLKKK